MKELLCNSVYFGVVLSLAAYWVGMFLKKRFRLQVLNPLMIAIALTIIVLLICGVDYQSYNQSARYLTYLLTPATVCLAIPLYEQFKLLKQNVTAIMVGISSGVVTALLSIFLMSLLFRLGHQEYVTLLPKSITTAIGIGLSEEMEGYVSITVASIMITGLFGNIAGEMICRLFRITHPIAKGVAFGTAAHVMGTSRAMEIGKVEGAMSSLSIVVAGLLTVLGAILFEMFI